VKAMSRALSLEPPDLLDQLLDETISTFLIKGNPGSGKSTLALELLRRKGAGTYVTTRVTTEKIAMQNPRIRVDVVGRGPKTLAVSGKKIRAEDYQFAGPVSAIRTAFETAKSKKPGLVILDSWDSIAKEMDQVERLKAEKTMVASIQSSKSQLGFISEEPSMTTTDFLVDAVVELSAKLQNDYLVRKVEVRKLRGHEIGRPVHLFTLDHGLFRVCKSTHVLSPGQYEPKKFVAVKNPTRLYSSGVPDLDAVLGGGFIPGSVIALEFGRNVSPSDLLPFESVIYSNFISNGACVAVLPPAGVAPTSISDQLRALLPEPTVASNLRVGYYEEFGDPTIFRVDVNSLGSTMKKLTEVTASLKGPSGRPCFITLGATKLEYVHGKEKLLESIVTLITRVKSQGDVLNIYLTEATESKNALTGISDSHVLFEFTDDVLTSQQIKPSGPVTTIHYDYSRGYPQVAFLPIS